MTKNTDNDMKTILINSHSQDKEPDFTYYVIPTQRRRRNICSGGVCCLFLFLAQFFYHTIRQRHH